MYAGRMVEGAESDELIQHPAHPYTQLLLSAVPDPTRGHVKRETVVRSQPTRNIDPSQGCPFARRCPHVMDVCRTIMPGVEMVAPRHWVRCHLHGSGREA